jgi:hypothetical protein
MLSDLKLVKLLALILLAVMTAAAQSGTVVLKSPSRKTRWWRNLA